MPGSVYRTTDQSRASWQLPAGVSRGTWDYVTESAIAADYDRFHAGHPLLELDMRLIAEHLGPLAIRSDGSRRIAVDFGCGTGRNLVPLAEQGWRVVGVDLSLDMLGEYRTKAASLTQNEAVAIAPIWRIVSVWLTVLPMLFCACIVHWVWFKAAIIDARL